MSLFDENQALSFLGGLTAKEFMQEYWGKKPLFVKGAYKDFQLPISIADFKQMALQDGFESRLLMHKNQHWTVDHGPFEQTPEQDDGQWSLLVQSVDLHSDAVAALAKPYRFISDARFDDVMISLANLGGGVGPHIDTYDVFLIQGHGTRRWSIGLTPETDLIPDLPLRLLAHFEPQYVYEVEPGDLLYLPPHWAHDGVATSHDCVTISVGFRTITQANMVRGILEATLDQVSVQNNLGTGIYAEPVLGGLHFPDLYEDPNAQPSTTPARLPDHLIDTALDAMKKVVFTPALAQRFLGCWLTEPNQLSQFDMPEEEIDLQDYPPSTLIKLNRQTRMLYRGDCLYINGEQAPIALNETLKQLANDQQISIQALLESDDEDTLDLIYNWLDDGWLVIDSKNS